MATGGRDAGFAVRAISGVSDRRRPDPARTRFPACHPRFLGGAPHRLLCLPQPLELVPIPVAGLPRFLRQYPEPLGLSPGSLGDHAMFFGDVAVRLGLLTAIFSTPGPALGLPALLFYRPVIFHFGPTPERRVFIRQEVCPTATK